MTPDTQTIAFNAAYSASDSALAFLFESAAVNSGYTDRETLSAATKRVDLDEDEFDDEDEEDDFDEDDEDEEDDEDDEEEEEDDEEEDEDEDEYDDDEDDEKDDKDDEEEDELNLI